MTKKDYITLAKWINENWKVSDKTTKFVLEDMSDQLAQLLEIDNPRFDYNKFRKACHKE